MHLHEMMTYCRPGRSQAEEKFIKRFIEPTGAMPDGFGNYVLRVGTAPVLWASHTDTVHATSGRQIVVIDKDGRMTSDGTCLGADDTTGVWLMLEMVRAGIEGLYIWHRDEETGMNGSAWIVEHTPELLDGIQCAIAFDRRGYDSVVTHQASERCASDEFARALADGIGLGMQPDPTGVFTDTLSYIDLVPECTNVSVGYHNAHSRRESQDTGFAGALLRTLLTLDVGALPIKRDPSVREYERDDWVSSRQANGIDALYRAVLDEPGAACDLLFTMGFTADDIHASA